MTPELRQEVALTGGALLIAASLIGLASLVYLHTVSSWEEEQQQGRHEVSWEYALPTDQTPRG